MTEHNSTAEARAPAKKGSSINVRSEDDFLHEQAQLMRAGVYELLASLLAREPTAEVLGRLADMDEVDASEGQIAMGWELLRQASRKTSVAELVDELRDEYFNLFLGVGRGELVPFGSWYMTGYLMEKPLSLLRADLQLLGIERQYGVKETEDHIAGLCDAMAIMIRSGEEIEFERQKQFFEDHLAPWALRFFADMQSAQSAHYYRSVGFFGESFFEFEQQMFLMQS